MSLPSPTDTPYSTPVPSLSRRSSRYASTSPGPSSPFSQDGFSTGVDNTSIDETLPLSDPRRFTPTLHASLVSQILNLQRELDSKHKFIDELETHLESTKTENEELSTKLRQTSRENKTVKQHLEQIEGGTLAALEELAKERDQTKEINEELKTKVDSFQKKIKTQEEESVRVHDQWQNEKEEWDNAKRGLERRVHATETRLKIILTELEAQQAHDHHAEHEAEDHGRESVAGNESDTASISSMNRTSSITRGGRHRRNMSSSSHRSIGRNWRFSTVSGAGSEGFAKLNGGLSLADELNFDEEDEDELEYLEDDDDEFAEHELRARRALESRQSMYPDEKAKRILGLMGAESRTIQSEHPQGQTSDDIPRPRKSSVVDEFLPSSILARHEPITLPAEGSRPSSPIKRPLSPVKRPASPAKRPVSPTKRPPSPVKPKIQYVDTAIQYSPPPSPPIVSKPTEPTIGAADIEANQRRKRISASPSATNLKQSTNQQQKRTMSMVSSSSQTVEPPLSPPATPSLSGPPSPQLPASAFHAETANVATQTDPVEEQPVHMEPPPRSPMRIAPPPPILIPSIAIIPPVSAPTSPKEPRLPTGTKSASCQTSSNELGSTRDSSMQTEAISVDRRLAKLPPHLLPSAVRSKPGTPEPALKKPIITINGDIPDESVQKSQQQSPVEKPNSASGAPVQSEPPPIPRYATQTRQNEHIVRARAAASSAKKAEVDSSILRKPYNASTLFAGFNGASSDEDDDDVDASDDESWMEHTIQDARTHTFRNKLGKRPMGSPPTPVPEEKESAGSAGKTVVASGKAREIDSLKRLSREISPTRRSSLEKPAKVSKPVRQSNLGRQLSIRRSAMIQNGAAAHQRPRSPSAGSHEAEINHILMKPPFPVPTRSSSRRLPLSKSEGSQSPTPGSGLGFANRFGRGAGARHSRNDSLRKIRSAAVIPKTGRVNGRPRSRSPPLPSPTFDGADLPPLPRDMVAAPQSQKPFFLHRHQPSNNTFNTATGSIGSSVQSSSVVDAITATAVGEWMWKYVRRRKSFNVPESPLDPKTGEEGTGGVRHKRWVWLSPYERSVMWSSKQPTSGTALLGKNGRKCKSSVRWLFRRLLTSFCSNYPVRSGRVGQYAAAQEPCKRGSIQSINPHSDSPTCSKVHGNLSGPTLFVAHCLVFPGPLE